MKLQLVCEKTGEIFYRDVDGVEIENFKVVNDSSLMYFVEDIEDRYNVEMELSVYEGTVEYVVYGSDDEMKLEEILDEIFNFIIYWRQSD